MFRKNTYEEDINAFEIVSSTKADILLSDENKAFVYIGRETCPFCRKFAKKLSSLANKIDTTIYYVDSDDFFDGGIDSFRAKYNIVTVPGFIVHKNGELEVRCDSSLSEDEILNLVK